MGHRRGDPAQIAVLDKGEAIVLSEENGKFMKLKLKGKKLKVLWIAAQQEGAKIGIVPKK